MAAQLEISEAKSRFDEIVNRARCGEEITLSDGGHPVAKLSPVHVPNGSRVFGEFAGKVQIADDFAAPLDAAEQAEWEK
jgi:prevent-host-death family protein